MQLKRNPIMKKLLFLIVFLLTISVAYAQMANPVKVQSQIKEISATEAELIFNATIEAGWHMYSTEVVEFGPTPTSLTVEKISGAKLNGVLKPKSSPIKKFEEINLKSPDWYAGDVTAFNMATFGSFMSSTMSAASSNMGSTATHSSGGGGGGGGFSGGGGGGGGGGSW